MVYWFVYMYIRTRVDGAVYNSILRYSYIMASGVIFDIPHLPWLYFMWWVICNESHPRQLIRSSTGLLSAEWLAGVYGVCIGADPAVHVLGEVGCEGAHVAAQCLRGPPPPGNLHQPVVYVCCTMCPSGNLHQPVVYVCCTMCPSGNLHQPCGLCVLYHVFLG